MMLKRKRSDSEISTSRGSILSSPPSHNIMDLSFSSPFNSQSGRDLATSQLSSRTRKRYRDNRPSESMVHQHTLSILYSAQQTPLIPPQPIKSLNPQPATVTNYFSLSSQQTSLHSFWALPSRPISSGSSDASNSSPPPVVSFQATNCEDCDANLVSAGGDAMDVDIDVDISGDSTDYGCSSCGKQICHMCAISNLGDQRSCLNCAGKKQWVGGFGWMDQD